VLRKGLNSDLSFSAEDRAENLRRMSEVAKLILETGTLVLASFIAPKKVFRDRIKTSIGKNNYLEVFVDTPLSVCEARDVKGLYQKARKEKLENFTGITQTYEIPVAPEITLTYPFELKKSVDEICNMIEAKIVFSEIKSLVKSST